MDWIQRLEESLDYIEENLAKEINYEELGKIACCSSYHYQRVFSYIANVSLSEYIRRRKMSMAGVDLQQGEKVIDVALKYGYESPDSFARAFRKIHGVLPSEAQKSGIKLVSYPRIRFHISIRGDVEMEYRIEQKEAFKIIGFKKSLSSVMEDNFMEVPKFWHEVASSGKLMELFPLMTTELKGILGVSIGFGDGNEGENAYYIAVASNETPSVDTLDEYIVGAGTWAIFSGNGPMPTAIQELEKRMVTEWLPSSGYEYANRADIELYLNQDPENSSFEVWLPVVKKENE